MCFSAPKPPPVIEDPELKAQQQAARDQAAQIRAQNKKTATADEIARQMGKVGRGSLLSGGAGGAGFAAPLARSLLAVRG